MKEEENRVKQQQRELNKLEKIELKFIRRLKSTQLAQKKALEDLESTIQCNYNRPSSSVITSDNADWRSENNESERFLRSSSSKMDIILEESFDTTTAGNK